MVIWLTGKSGVGKTSIDRALCGEWPNAVFLDGDELREAICEDLGFSLSERRVSERRASRLSTHLADQRINVVCAKPSNVPEIGTWNRCQIPGYREVSFRTEQIVLEATDAKGLYRRFLAGEIHDVVGMDIPFRESTAPWLTLDNDHCVTIDAPADRILRKLRDESSPADLVRTSPRVRSRAGRTSRTAASIPGRGR